ncbi:serine--tRNA ligase [Prochlorococcus sp. MIT 1341]|uniref:serine--tRNA ligase n=1 Tax=Prochlorococcus sp. MIT 1341 TaxID=3096221 RepID=UPI002A76163D|nr:serine--tRNA ligase [Prochlorococcus sp. MIT 1341]
MLDQRLVRENPNLIAQQLARRGMKVDLSEIQLIAKQQRDLEEQRSKLQAEGNLIGKKVGELIQGGISPKSNEVLELRTQGNHIKQKVTILESAEKKSAAKLQEGLLNLPNIPDQKCPDGKDEKDNKKIREWGKPRIEEGLKKHWEIGEGLELFETERAARVAQSRFVILMNQGAKLERALINFMLDLHSSKGYKEILPPVLVNTASLTGSGQLPKFAEESFRCAEDDLWLTPTAEVPVTSIHRGEILPSEKLPIKYVAYSPCFRREAGSYGKDTRGLIRLHQFNKVELYWFVAPEQSESSHEQITSDAEEVLKKLELPYRVIDLCTGDLGFSAARTFDLEVWLPGAKAFREISSCSNCKDFQARRSSIRTKANKTKKLIHTLNASGLAIGRTMAALLETGQQADGSVKLPKSLVPYFGADHLKPAPTNQ